MKAMDRPLINTDQATEECYVALTTINGEPVFGRAWSNCSRVQASFPYGDKEYHSQALPTFQLLTYPGSPKQYFRYVWIPINQLNCDVEPVRRGEYSPAVVIGINVDSFRGEMLGKCNIARRMAWISYDGQEYHFTGDKFDNAYVLCRASVWL